MSLHVFGFPAAPTPPPPVGPSILPDAFFGVVFDTDFQTVDDKGEQNCYELCWLVSDIVHGYFLIAQFQQNSDGTHQERILLTQKGVPVIDAIHPVTVDPLGAPSPVKLWGPGDTLQFFLNKDKTLQLFWYRNGAIVSEQNTTNIPADFSITDEAPIAMPMEGASTVKFTGFKAHCQMGQIYQTAGHVPTQNAADSPFEMRAPLIASNLVPTVTGSHPGIEGVDFTLASV